MLIYPRYEFCNVINEFSSQYFLTEYSKLLFGPAIADSNDSNAYLGDIIGELDFAWDFDGDDLELHTAPHNRINKVDRAAMVNKMCVHDVSVNLLGDV